MKAATMMSSSAFKRLKVWILMLFWRQVILYMEEGANSCKNEKQAAKCHNPTIPNHLLELSSWTPNLQEAIPSWNTPACPLSITVPSVVLAADLFIFYFYFSCVETCFKWPLKELQILALLHCLIFPLSEVTAYCLLYDHLGHFESVQRGMRAGLRRYACVQFTKETQQPTHLFFVTLPPGDGKQLKH